MHYDYLSMIYILNNYQHEHSGLVLTVSSRYTMKLALIICKEDTWHTSAITVRFAGDSPLCIHSIPALESVVLCGPKILTPSTWDVDLDRATRSSSSIELLAEGTSCTVGSGLPGGVNGDVGTAEDDASG